ncbi:hypothetical protein COLO4_21388 [Corchorus olitorius]|uniref:Uncharacterized protein n=1 Tax=Corchorus olitorius TaxID=93759 RepID=A0A1R3ITM3_9ROSI|nr:hypothetical protein COLO4_21388 [Corchorus olitorius]
MVVRVELGVKRSRERYCGAEAAGFDNNYKKGVVFLEGGDKSCLGAVGLHREGCSFTSRLA